MAISAQQGTKNPNIQTEILQKEKADNILIRK